jgi:hypothetical protein
MPFVAGLDLGQSQDFSCLIVLEKTELVMGRDPGELEAMVQVQKEIDSGCRRAAPGTIIDLTLGMRSQYKRERRYALRFMERWVLGSSYPKIVDRVCQLFSKPPLEGATLVIDRTGCGRPVCDLFRQALVDPLRPNRPRYSLVPITITGGSEPTPDEQGGWKVPKSELVSSLQTVLQTRRIKFAKVPLAAQLIRELENFRVKVSEAGNESYAAWRERDHDDTVLSTAIAIWWSERAQKEYWIR